MTGCQRDFRGPPDDGWSPAAQFAPSLRPTFGARVTDGELWISLGPGCDRISKLTLRLDWDGPMLVLTGTRAKLEHFPLLGPYPGLQVATALPPDVDWRKAQTIHLDVEGGPGGFPGQTPVAEVVEGSAGHPADTYFYQGMGWLTESEAADRDQRRYLAPCSKDPERL